MIRCQDDMIRHLCADSVDGAKRNVYKYTDCGAWIEFFDGGVRVGSIVEGADYGTTIYKLEYPFTEDTYDKAIGCIESEAECIWQFANNDGPDPCDVHEDGGMSEYADGVSC